MLDDNDISLWPEGLKLPLNHEWSVDGRFHVAQSCNHGLSTKVTMVALLVRQSHGVTETSHQPTEELHDGQGKNFQEQFHWVEVELEFLHS